MKTIVYKKRYQHKCISLACSNAILQLGVSCNDPRDNTHANVIKISVKLRNASKSSAYFMLSLTSVIIVTNHNLISRYSRDHIIMICLFHANKQANHTF